MGFGFILSRIPLEVTHSLCALVFSSKMGIIIPTSRVDNKMEIISIKHLG